MKLAIRIILGLADLSRQGECLFPPLPRGDGFVVPRLFRGVAFPYAVS